MKHVTRANLHRIRCDIGCDVMVKGWVVTDVKAKPLAYKQRESQQVPAL